MAYVWHRTMGSSYSTPERPPPPAGVTRICVSGWPISPPTRRADELSKVIASKPGYESWSFLSMMNYKTFLREMLELVKNLDEDVKSQMSTDDKNTRMDEHHSSPFCWLETLGTNNEVVITPIGGRDKLQAWALETFPDDADPGTPK
uniref:Uncharacterized protein n=1 Tax=Octactis speculum TaxID=3111310 RepID=A0A7S2GKX6_9STRA